MKSIFTLLIFFTCTIGHTFSQANFQSAATGNWDAPATWTLLSGTSTTNYPVAGDDVLINAGHVITVNTNSQCGQMNINAAAQLLLNSTSSILTVTGTVNQGGAAAITITQGAFTVVGLMFITPPTTNGTTLLDVEGGAFSCAGTLTITGTSTTRVGELRIGSNALTNVAGALSAVGANGRINFTGNGTLTLAGVISINNPNSFIAGNGRVVYVGIPGSDQVIAPVTYNRLVVTGVGSGSKKINGAVIVSDTLTLLTDTLAVNTGGTLTINNAATIVRTAGKLISAPVFSGVADILYNNVTKDTTGAEIPSNTSVLRDLTISNISGIKLGSNISVNNKLHLLQGALITDIFSLIILNTNGGTTDDPAIERVNGYVLGALNRSIGTSTGIRIFPVGVSGNNGYRAFTINYTIAPTTAGSLQVQHINSAAILQSGLPLNDAGVSLVNVATVYWQADALSGLAGGTYSLSVTAEGIPGVSNISFLRIIKRPSTGGAWTLNGIAGTNSGTTTAPVVTRTGMSGFSQFAIASSSVNTLPVTLLYFSGNASGKKAELQWATSMEINSKNFIVERSMDRYSFTALGTIAAAGNSSQQRNYLYPDNYMMPGTNYYRIKETDADGNFNYSNIISLNSTAAGIRVYPTMVTSSLFIENPGNERLNLINVSGQYLKQLQTGSNSMIQLPAGTYYIVSEGKETIVFIKQ